MIGDFWLATKSVFLHFCLPNICHLEVGRAHQTHRFLQLKKVELMNYFSLEGRVSKIENSLNKNSFEY